MLRFDKLFKGANKKSIGAFEELYSVFGADRSTWSKSSQLEQYGKSLYVFAAVNKIAVKVANIDLKLFFIKNSKGDVEEITSHEILDLLYKINPYQTRSEFLRTTWINKKLTGEAFWLKVRNSSGDVVELWNLRPDLMTVVADPVEYIKYYEFMKDGSGKPTRFTKDDIVFFKDPDPLNQFQGMSPLIASKTRIETETSASTYQRNFFKNNARPDALLITDQQLGEEQRTQMTSAWEDRHQGEKFSSKVGILEGGMKYQQVSVSQKEMDFIESMKFTRDDILVALGVPKSVITTDDVNYANAEAGMRMFLSETIVPEMKQLVEVLNEFLIVPDFGEEYFLDFEDPTPDDREAKRADSTAAHGKWMTVNEIRETHNLPPIEGGDVIATQQPTTQPIDGAVKQHVSNPKNLRGRPILRHKLQLTETIKAEIESTKKVIKQQLIHSKKKSEQKVVNRVSMLNTPELRKEYYEFANKELDIKAQSLKEVLDKEFIKQRQRILKNLRALEGETKGANRQKLLHAQLGNILDKQLENKLLSVVALPFLTEYAEEAGLASAVLLGDNVFDMSADLMKALEARSMFFASSVNDTTFAKLTETLSEGINEGEGVRALSSRVRDVYDDVEEWRATMIARTETTYANNKGLIDQFKQSDVVIGKEWLNSGDSRVRDSHEDKPIGVGGEIVDVDATFTNGLEFPSEINCRCVLLPVISGESTIRENSLKKLITRVKGGQGSGNWGHSGRPGKRGGSSGGAGMSGGGGSAESKEFMDKFGSYQEYLGIYEAKDGLTYEETLAVGIYTSSEYDKLNTQLRGFEELDADRKLLSKYVDSGLAKLPVEKGTVHRGITTPSQYPGDAHDFVKDTFAPGKTFADKSYMSTSKSEDIASKYTLQSSTGIMLEINSSTGRNIDALSMIKGEQEIVFSRNTNFRVASVEYLQDFDRYHIKLDEQSTKRLSRNNKWFLQALQESDKLVKRT